MFAKTFFAITLCYASLFSPNSVVAAPVSTHSESGWIEAFAQTVATGNIAGVEGSVSNGTWDAASYGDTFSRVDLPYGDTGASPAHMEDEPEDPALEEDGIHAAAASVESSQQLSAQDLDFQARCTAGGVVRCFDFDSQEQVQRRLYSAWDGTQRGTVDTAVKASGKGSLRLTIPPNSPDNSSGGFSLNFSDNYSIQFGEGQEFYVQWRQRFSPEMLNTYFKDSHGFKQIIIGEGDNPGDTAYSCTELEIVMQNAWQRGLPIAYHSCNRFIPFTERYGNGDTKLQNAIPQPYCLDSKNPGGQLRGNPPCFSYKPNQWMTFQVHVKIGNWNKPNSLVEIWGAEEGKPSVQFVRAQNVVLYQGDPPSAKTRYGKVWLTNYQTAKSSSQNHPAAHTWYDELIISRSKIADPAGAADIKSPAPPRNFRIPR